MNATNIEFQTVARETHPEPVANQARGYGIEHPLQDEAGRRSDGNAGLLIIRATLAADLEALCVRC